VPRNTHRSREQLTRLPAAPAHEVIIASNPLWAETRERGRAQPLALPPPARRQTPSAPVFRPVINCLTTLRSSGKSIVRGPWERGVSVARADGKRAHGIDVGGAAVERKTLLAVGRHNSHSASHVARCKPDQASGSHRFQRSPLASNLTSNEDLDSTANTACCQVFLAHASGRHRALLGGRADTCPIRQAQGPPIIHRLSIARVHLPLVPGAA
jgi:hypothetical protein